MPHKKQHHLPNHVDIAEYAKIKGVARGSVYGHIEKGDIIPDVIGRAKKPMIDLEKYLDFDFRCFLKPRVTKKVKLKPVKYVPISTNTDQSG